MLGLACYVQCMMEGAIMLTQLSNVAAQAVQAPVGETASAPTWPLILVLLIAVTLANRPRAKAPAPRR